MLLQPRTSATAVMTSAAAMKMIMKRRAVVCAKWRSMAGTEIVKMAARVLAMALMSGVGTRTTSDFASSLLEAL